MKKEDEDWEYFINIAIGNIAYTIQSRLDVMPKKYKIKLLSQLIKWLNKNLENTSE